MLGLLSRLVGDLDSRADAKLRGYASWMGLFELLLSRLRGLFLSNVPSGPKARTAAVSPSNFEFSFKISLDGTSRATGTAAMSWFGFPCMCRCRASLRGTPAEFFCRALQPFPSGKGCRALPPFPSGRGMIGIGHFSKC
jgi:hypothetical protein